MSACPPRLMQLPRSLFGLWAALLLAVVGLQATTPIAAPLEPAHGSAFSATTFEVALAAQRRADPARHAPLPLPPAPPQLQSLAAAAFLVPVPAPRPASTGPPPRDILAFHPAPRGPPRA